MLFNSFQFTIFFIIVFTVYASLSHSKQNRFLLLASYFFYALSGWQFLPLLIISTLIDYFCAIKIEQSKPKNKKKLFLTLSIVGNLLLLGIFKYLDFITQNFTSILTLFGLPYYPELFNIILPVGISFYTFQTMGYTIDVYQGKIKASRKLLDFALFASFFPQLVAGPIERAKNLIPQILAKRSLTLNNLSQGVYLIIWGLFLKIFVADNLAKYVDGIFLSDGPYQSGQVILSSYAFAWQIFADFAGYTSIARGVARCLGFDLMKNFNLPYFVTNPRDFWRRWHISLSNWFRDYLYIPLGGSRNGKFRTYFNLVITMLLCGLWHGAAWTFIIWGLYHGILLIIYRALKPFYSILPKLKNQYLAKAWLWLRIIFFFQLTSFGWLIFRSSSLSQLKAILSALFAGLPKINIIMLNTLIELIFFIALVLIIQLWQYRKNDPLVILKTHWAVRALVYVTIYFLLLFWGVKGINEFIYFKF